MGEKICVVLISELTAGFYKQKRYCQLKTFLNYMIEVIN